MPLPVSDLIVESSTDTQAGLTVPPVVEDERPPQCPSCNKRLVILATHSVRDGSGAFVRQQLWGCPKGHATATRRAGVFSAVTMLGELVG
jgi:hypothetical protein